MSEVHEIVERVARAICLEQGYDPDFNYDPNGLGSKVGNNLRWRLFVDAARAAIEAMRKPTKAMVSAGYDVGYSPDPLPCDQVFTAMIDEVLK